MGGRELQDQVDEFQRFLEERGDELMPLLKEGPDGWLRFFNAVSAPVPTLFGDICRLYRVNVPVFIIDPYLWVLFRADDPPLCGTVLREGIEGNIGAPIAICLSRAQCTTGTARGRELSPFNSKIHTLLHEIIHIVCEQEIASLFQSRWEMLRKAPPALRVTLLKNCTEGLVQELASLAYKDLHPCIRRSTYEWIRGKKPKSSLRKVTKDRARSILKKRWGVSSDI